MNYIDSNMKNCEFLQMAKGYQIVCDLLRRTMGRREDLRLRQLVQYPQPFDSACLPAPLKSSNFPEQWMHEKCNKQ